VDSREAAGVQTSVSAENVTSNWRTRLQIWEEYAQRRQR